MIGITMTAIAVSAAAGAIVARRQPTQDILAAAILFGVGLIIQGVTP